VVAVVTNAGLTAYTMTTLDGFSMEFKFWVFILFQWTCFMLQVKELFMLFVLVLTYHGALFLKGDNYGSDT